MKNSLYALFLSLLLAGCNSSPENINSFESTAGMFAEEVQIIETRSPIQENDITEETDLSKKKIIKEGRIGLEVSDLATGKFHIDSLLSRHKGYYANEDYKDTNYETSYQLTIRIPNSSYEDFISAIEAGKGKILYKTINARDVTEQYVDISTRLENKRSYLQHYREILKKANTIKDILEVEQYIRMLEEEIESSEGRLRYLTDRVAYSTLELNLKQTKEYVREVQERDSFLFRTLEALSFGWNMVIGFILLLIHLWPVILFIGLCLYLWKRRKRKSK